MKQIIKDALILFAITLVAGVLLAVVNEITKAPIEAQEVAKKSEACQRVLPEAETFTLLELPTEALIYQNWCAGHEKNEISECYGAYDASGSLVGYVISVRNKEAYSGSITIAMGIRLDRSIGGVSVLETSETVGLGLEAEKVLSPQFTNQNAESFVYTKNGATKPEEIDAISSATITTNAFVNGVNAGLSFYDEILAQGGIVNE